MQQQLVGGRGVSGTRAALAELLVQLRRGAVDGAVPESAFVAQVQKLGLGDVEQERLRAELGRLGVPVQTSVVHTDADRPVVEKVVRNRVGNVLPRLDPVLALLGRYADTDGCVTSRAFDGVVRLAGLNAREAAALRTAFRVRSVIGGSESAGEAGERDGGATQDQHTDGGEDGPEGEGEPLPELSGGVVPADGDFTPAVTAALAVLQEDRFRLRPDKSLLTAEEEVGLSVLVRGGADSVADEPDKETLRALPPGDIRIRARDCLVLHNQRLVHKLVPRHLDQGLDYDDLFQHGVLGLMTAARKFDPLKGFKFSTYATWWIRQSISRGIADEGVLIRVPVHVHEQIRKVALAERTLYGQGKPAGVVDVAVFCDMTVEKVEAARRLSRRTDSLDRVIGDGATLGDFVGEARPLPSVEREVLHALLMEGVMAVVDTFSGRDGRVLVRRLGLDGDEPSTLDELGREFGVTRERIRQVESKALSTFRERLRMAGLMSAYNDRDGQGADGDGERRRPAKRRTPGKDSAAAAVREPRPDGERETQPEVLAAPTPEPEPSSPAEEETAVVEESGRHERDVLDTLAERTSSAPGTPTSESEPPALAMQNPPPVLDPGVLQSARYTADWDKILEMPPPLFGGGVAWLAEYALLAVGRLQLAVLLGSSGADAVVRAVQDRGMLDRPVVAALEVLQRVFDALKEVGHRPEHFFERPSEALVGATPRAYLAARPLVRGESRLAIRDALREFMDAQMVGRAAPLKTDDLSAPVEPVPDAGPEPVAPETESEPQCQQPVGDTDPPTVTASVDTTQMPHAAQPPVAADRLLAEARAEHEADVARLAQEHERRLREERRATEERVEAARVDAERQLDDLEQVLLQRVDRALTRQEQFLRRQTDERIARLKEEHREAQQAAARRVEHAEVSASAAAAERVSWFQARANEADQRLRRYREEGEKLTAALEARLRHAESQLADRDNAVRAAQQRAAADVAAAGHQAAAQTAAAQQQAAVAEQRAVAAEQWAAARVADVEQRAAARTAQVEHDAWARITELQEQLAALQGAATNRASIRDRWRRS